MNLQNRTLHRYRQMFPQETLKEISVRTGIQITRVFRLMNGKPMKVGELEAFENAVTSKIAENPSYGRLQTLIEESFSLLTNEELAKLADKFERTIMNRKYNRTYIQSVIQDLYIA